MAIHVINEARRCLQCKKPLCRLKGCPAQTNIPEMIRLFLNGNINEAGEMLFANNPMSVVCSLVCDHEKQCEGNCIQGHKGAPVQISSIEHYISDIYLDKVIMEHEPPKGQNIAVIGSGPAGITVSVKLAQRGYDVTIFERKSKLGGMMRYGIPSFRLPLSILDRYQKKLLELGIHIRPNTTIGGVLTLDTLFRDGYDAVFIGSGVWRARGLGVKGESLGCCHYAVDYLQNPDVYNLGDRVAIIGSGNSAMDAARTAVRKGSRYVTVYARRNEVRASIREYEYAQADGVEFEFNKGVDSITREGPMLKERHFDEEGKLIGEDEAQLYPADSTIIAVSQGPKDKIVRSTTGLEVNERGLVEVDENGATTRDGVFSAGDVVLGPCNVVQVVKDAKHVANSIDEYLTKKREAAK
ncbi:NAD(P)-dependent oxidoreductase [uncultured Mitsuokella sp.]|uniref:NAD(P)-dependent oxidoreductase n=1 Tax=uncultured Mitsuokella sp. TaxID=453120 RepID=UPI0026DACDE0|nr:NAD(P)-dependent oxidoreductase [uncultured Mitsuokella sp.]